MRKFSKQILKSFRNLCEADDGGSPNGGSPNGKPFVQNTPEQLYHGQGGMAGYNTRTVGDVPLWMYIGIPAYTAPNGIVVIPPDPRTGLFLPNMLPGVHSVITPGPWGVNFYTFDYNQLGGMTETNAYNLLMLNLFQSQDAELLAQIYANPGDIDLLALAVATDIRDAFNSGVPGFNQGDHTLFYNTFFADQSVYFKFMQWWQQSHEDLQDGTLNWNEIQFPYQS